MGQTLEACFKGTKGNQLRARFPTLKERILAWPFEWVLTNAGVFKLLHKQDIAMEKTGIYPSCPRCKPWL